CARYRDYGRGFAYW
nr:immunoglobulin heavy chain junction region [Mus musculus]